VIHSDVQAAFDFIVVAWLTILTFMMIGLSGKR
jgi:hypothetical protein